ncbi:hypothetical protein Syun_011564 [Stephania yunnanensis]|uniref:Uncharacterized protein n=1 Tax=Stephania yunnanensis TaxID=152371 RepID=A0AAP0PGL3_9MAGN
MQSPTTTFHLPPTTPSMSPTLSASQTSSILFPIQEHQHHHHQCEPSLVLTVTPNTPTTPLSPSTPSSDLPHSFTSLV